MGHGMELETHKASTSCGSPGAAAGGIICRGYLGKRKGYLGFRHITPKGENQMEKNMDMKWKAVFVRCRGLYIYIFFVWLYT